MLKKLPKSFFEKERPSIENESKQDDLPMEWDEDVLSGEKKVEYRLPSECK